MYSWLNIFILLSSLSACKNTETPVALSAIELKGKNIFLNNCFVCHNPDIKRPETIGPNITGASLELVTARVLRAQYPEHYLFKRKSSLMPAFPELEKDLPAIHAYINSAEFKTDYNKK